MPLPKKEDSSELRAENHVAFKLPCLDVAKTLDLEKNIRRVERTVERKLSKTPLMCRGCWLFKTVRKGKYMMVNLSLIVGHIVGENLRWGG